MSLVALSLGTNAGDRRGLMGEMLRGVHGFLEPPVNLSPLMETEPVGVSEDQPWYYNMIVCGECEDEPEKLLTRCLQLEKSLGRQRPYRYAPRTADIDILFFDQVVMNSDSLTLPHPAVLRRRFCIEGLGRIVPHFRLPGHAGTFGDLLRHMPKTVAEQKVNFVTSDFAERMSRHG